MFPGLGYAVAMTQTQAIVWRYIQSTGSVDSKPSIIKLLHPSNTPGHPLPFGILVPTSAEPAFLVVMPASGEITYWESLSTAASVDVNRQRQQGNQGSLNGMLSGEIITKVTEGEPHGFVLTLSSGRVAHMTVSDPQGKPSINVQFLWNNGAHSVGLFGSLRSAFSGAGWRRDVAAVRAGISWQRGQRCVIVATTRGSFQVWDLNWNGAHSLLHEIDAKEDLLKAITEGGNVFPEHEEHLFEILDFTFLPNGGTGKELAKSTSQGDCKLLVLTALSGRDSSRYALLGLKLANGSVEVQVVHPISCYTTPVSADPHFRPQVLVPEPGHTAFIIFGKSVVLVSLVEIEDSPSSQLQKEARTLPDPFQDTIDFRKNKTYQVVGCASEMQERDHVHASCVVAVHGFGIIRVTALPMERGQSASDRVRVTAKTKLEQAVFFGSLQKDLLDFSGRPEISFPLEEVEAAALEVSGSIMGSEKSRIPGLPPSMEHQLQQRATALADLIRHLKLHYQPLSRLTRWKLLWNAEKMAAARAIWRSYNTAIRHKHENENNILTELLDYLHEDFKKENKPEEHETDLVRHWFSHDIWRLEYIVPWTHEIIEQLIAESSEGNTKYDNGAQARSISEAVDLQLAALETAYQFREANAALYGLDEEPMVDGVLQNAYEDLPEIWTSGLSIVENVKLLTDVAREFAVNHATRADEDGEPSLQLIQKLAERNPRQVQVCCQVYIERSRWLLSQSDPQLKASGDALQQAHLTVRKTLFVQLSEVGHGDAGIALAEKYQDMEALVNIIEFEMDDAQKTLTDGDSKAMSPEARLLEDLVDSYFVKYGAAWSNAYFTKQIGLGRITLVLNSGAKHQSHLTSFLRRHPGYIKLSWINEATAEQQYGAAGDCLRTAAKQETNLWSKKIELSLGKLSTMAARAKKQTTDDHAKTAIKRIDQALAAIAVQDSLYKYIKPTLKNALDTTAAIEFATQKCGKNFVEGKSALREAMSDNIARLVAREALDSLELIDTLTLMDGDRPDPRADYDFLDTRFFSAFKLLKISGIKDEGKQLYEKIIWRRCMIQDDWESINRTELKDDTQVEVETGATALFKTLREGYKTCKFLPLPQRPSTLTHHSLLQHQSPTIPLLPPHPRSLPSRSPTVLPTPRQHPHPHRRRPRLRIRTPRIPSRKRPSGRMVEGCCGSRKKQC